MAFFFGGDEDVGVWSLLKRDDRGRTETTLYYRVPENEQSAMFPAFISNVYFGAF